MSHSTRFQEVVGQLASMALPICAMTMDYRVASFDPAGDPRHPDHAKEHCLFVFWHEYIATLIPNWGWADLTLLVSQHRDAEWLNQVAARMGFNMTRGSSTRGGHSAIRRLKRLGKHSSLVITPDGPRGPRRDMAPGAVYLASKLQMPIIPVGVGVRFVHRLKTWDRFVIPFPGSRIRVVFGPKIRIDSGLAREDLPVLCNSLSQSLNSMNELAQHWVEETVTLNGYRPKPRLRRGGRSHAQALPQPLQLHDDAEAELRDPRAA